MVPVSDFILRARARWLDSDRPLPSSVDIPGPGQESVWTYPRPPVVEPVTPRVRVAFGGRIIADSRHVVRVLETSHPPTYYFPLRDVDRRRLHPEASPGSLCEWKGWARYWTVAVGLCRADRAAWDVADPFREYAQLAGHLAFYCGAMDACWVGSQRATPQPGGTYGGWVTPDLVGPFKGVPGSTGW